MAYAAPEQLTARYDARVIRDLVSDNSDVQTSIDSLTSHPVVLDALEDASGQIRSAAMVANKYTDDELSALEQSQDPFLVRLTCTLAIGYLLNRRSMGRDPLPPNIEQAENWLAALRLGERIFNVQANADAGNMKSATLSIAQRTELGLVADQTRFFPARRQYS